MSNYRHGEGLDDTRAFDPWGEAPRNEAGLMRAKSFLSRKLPLLEQNYFEGLLNL